MAKFDANMLKDPKVRAIEIEANRLAGADGDNSLAERFQIRNQLRAEQGLPPEKRKRGGLAGAYDEGFLLPAAAIALGPLALGLASGGGAGTAAGGTAASMGGIPPIPAAGGAAGGIGGAAGGAAPWSLGGLASQAGDWFKDPKNIMKLGAGAYGISQQQKGAGQMNDALQADKARWAAGAPLREAGAAGMLNPIAADTSSLDALAGQGNPFGKKPLPPMPIGSMGGR